MTSAVANEIKTPCHLHDLRKTPAHVRERGPVVPPTDDFFLARAAIITHSEWLWKVYSFLKSNKNNRVTITVSDVAVSFHCVSPSSDLFFFFFSLPPQ